LSFHAWLMLQRERDDSIGDLARDARQDRHFPKRRGLDYDSLYLYLFEAGACPRALAAFDRAWAEYQHADRRKAVRVLTVA
jgi:uncharacterized protein YozE (UPF0346 family)